MRSSIAILYQELWKLFRGSVAAVPKIAIGLLVFTVFIYGSRFLAKFVETLIWRRRKGKYHSAALLLGRIVRVGVVGFGMLIALSIIVPTFRASDLISFLGVSGVAVGFAFRDILQNFFAGVIIICSRVFDEGDQIITGDISGTVEQVQMRSTNLRTDDGQKIVVPNALLLNREVRLRNAYEAKRSEIEMPIYLSDDLLNSQKIIMSVLRANDRLASNPSPSVSVEKFTDTQIFLKLAWWLPVTEKGSAQLKIAVLGEIQARLRAMRAATRPRRLGDVSLEDVTMESVNSG